MYVPAENVYYKCFVKSTDDELGPGLQEYAFQRRVVPASPNSFYSYLQVVALGLKGMRVEREAREILARLDRLKGEVGSFRQEFSVLGRHLMHATRKYDELSSSVAKLDY